MALEGFKYWADGEPVVGIDANAFLMSQSVMRFDNASDRDSALARTLTNGMMAYNKSTTTLQLYDGSSWLDVATGTLTADHGALTGLADDDHTQYHNDARGDARYYTQSQVDSSLSGYLPLSGGTLTGDLTAGSGFITINASSTSEGGELRLDGGTSYSGTYARIDRYGSNLLRFMDGSAVRMSLDITNGNLAVGGSITSGGTAVSLSGHTHSYLSTSGGSVSGALQAYSMQGNSNVAGTGNAIYAPSGIYSTGTNWLYGTILTNGSPIGSTSQQIGEVYAAGWFRTYGQRGWYSQSYGGGWYMIDSTWLRTYGNKRIYSGSGQIRSDAGNAFNAPNMTATWSFNTVRWNTNGDLMRYASLTEMKTDIVEINGVLGYLNERSFLYDLTPRIFHEAEDRVDHEGNPVYTTRGEYGHGFLAEEVLEVAPELAFFDQNGELTSYANDALIPDIVAELQRLMPMVEELYGTAHPDWVPPSPRPPERAQEERDRYETARQQQAITGIEDPTDPLNGQRHLGEEEEN